MSELLVYLAVIDLREFGDDDIRDFLELLLGSIAGEGEEVARLRDVVTHQLELETLERHEISGWFEEFLELLPASFSDYPDKLEKFDSLLEATFEDAELENDSRVLRFQRCLELLGEAQGWQSRSEAARGIATLEEEFFVYRDHYARQPIVMAHCSSDFLVSHLNLLEGFESWQQAFRLAHQDKLDDALDAAFEGTCLFHAVERWAG